MTSREVVHQFEAVATPEGVGVTVHRSIGTPAQNTLDPFLLLDEFVIAGDAEGAGSRIIHTGALKPSPICSQGGWNTRIALATAVS